MRRYILKRYIDRYAPGDDVTDHYDAETLASFVASGKAQIITPSQIIDFVPTEPETPVTREQPVTGESTEPETVASPAPITEPVPEPVTKSTKKK